MTRFVFIHPSIVDLYVSALTLHILQEKLSKLGPTSLTQDLQAEVDQAASEYVVVAKNIEKIFKSPVHIQSQLNAFAAIRQGSA